MYSGQLRRQQPKWNEKFTKTSNEILVWKSTAERTRMEMVEHAVLYAHT